jgi:hypothetical protein
MDSQESTDKPKSSVVQKAARVWLVIGVIVLIAIAVGLISLVVGSINRANQHARIEEKRQQLHIATMKVIHAENDNWARLAKLQRSARTDEQRAFVRSEVAKLRALMAARERTEKAAEADLEKEIAQ